MPLHSIPDKISRRFPDDTPKRRKPFNIGSAFISAMYLFIVDRFGALSLPDDDWSWEVLWEYLNQYRLKGADARLMRGIANDVMPELSDADVAIMIEEIGEGRKVKGWHLAAILGLDFDTRDRLYRTWSRTILCIPCTDKTKAECAAIYAQRRADKKRLERLAAKAANPQPERKRGRPQGDQLWLAKGISKATWYRRNSQAKAETKMVRLKSRPYKKEKEEAAATDLVSRTVAERGTAADRPDQGKTGLPVAPSQGRQRQPQRKNLAKGKTTQAVTLARHQDTSERSQPISPPRQERPCQAVSMVPPRPSASSLPVPPRMPAIWLDWVPPANYGQAFDPAHPPTWAIAMRKFAEFAEAAAAGKAPLWVPTVLRLPSRKAA